MNDFEKKISSGSILKMLLCIVAISVFSGLFADEIDDKIRQLRQVEQDLEAAQQKVRQTETKKKQTQTEISKTSTLKKQTDEALKRLSQSEAVVKDSVFAVNRRLNSVNEDLSNLDKQQNQAMIALLKNSYLSTAPASVSQESAYLKSIVTQVNKHQDTLNNFRVLLTQDYEKKRSEHGRLTRNLRTTRSQSVGFDKQMRTLMNLDRQLSQEQINLNKQIAKLVADAAALETLIARLSAEAGKSVASYQFSTRKIPWPVRGKVIRAYGEETKSYGTSIVNNGIDIAVNEGTPVQAIDEGDVVFSDRYGGQGRLVILDHKNGFFSVYAYNSELLVNRGDKVKKGQIIAKTGMSGSATQPSLRFELRRDGKAVNPMNYLE